VTGEWRKLHDEELHNLCSSPNVIRMKPRRMRLAGQVARMRAKINVYRVLVGKPEGRKSRRKWEHNIKMNFREIGGGDMEWIYLAQDGDQWRALVNAVMNLGVA
jgi:hypothetical protein